MRLAQPLLSNSIFKTRLGLIRSRNNSCPLDALDFIMMDLERPAAVRRPADQCVGDLTGRVLEVWSAIENIDGIQEERLPELFNRILRTRQKSGLFGLFQGQPDAPQPVEDGKTSGTSRLFPALLRYWHATGDSRGLDAAMGVAEYLFRNEKKVHAACNKGWFNIYNWVTEPMALLYQATHDQRCLDFIQWHLERTPAEPANMTHSHGYTSTMRGYQLAAIFTGERSFNEKPELHLLDFMILPGMSPAVFPTAKRKTCGLRHCAVSPRIFRSTTYRSFFVKTITNNITKVPQTTNRKAENETFNRM